MSFACFCTKCKWNHTVGTLGLWFPWFNTKLVSIAACKSHSLIPIVQMRKRRPRSKYKQGQPDNLRLFSTASESLPCCHSSAPLWGDLHRLCSSTLQDDFLFGDHLHPFFLKKERALPHSWLQNKILFSFPAPSFRSSQ